MASADPAAALPPKGELHVRPLDAGVRQRFPHREHALIQAGHPVGSPERVDASTDYVHLRHGFRLLVRV
jgi:hypothetical protein